MSSPSRPASPNRSTRRPGALTHLIQRGVAVAILLVVVAGVYLFLRHNQADADLETVITPDQRPPVPVSVVTIRPETIPMHARFLGRTEASQVVELRARVAGYLLERTFEEGSVVTAGQVLFQIDPRPFEVERSQALARLESSEATLERTRQRLARIRASHATEAATDEELDEAVTQERIAAADVDLQKAQVAAVELQLEYTSIKAPITGRIGKALKDIGSYIDAGSSSAGGLLAVIQQVDPIYVEYPVTETEILRFERGIEARTLVAPAVDRLELEITLADGTIYPVRGHINFVDVQVDQETGTSLIRGEVSNPDGRLIPGQFIHATVLGVQRINVIRVPQNAVMMSPVGASVYVVDENGLVENRPVQLGEWSGSDYWIVDEGLREGDRIITTRLLTIRPGTRVIDSDPSPAGAGTAADPADPALHAETGGERGEESDPR